MSNEGVAFPFWRTSHSAGPVRRFTFAGSRRATNNLKGYCAYWMDVSDDGASERMFVGDTRERAGGSAR